MSNLSYLKQVRVASVGAGGIVDENGRNLRCIGNLPIQAGDTVWTDGKIVYGHRPIRESVNLPAKGSGIPFVGFGYGVLRRDGTPQGYIGDYDPPWLQWGGLPRGSRHLQKVWNWLYTTKDRAYCAVDNGSGGVTPADAEDLNYFLDLRVTDDAVYTVEYKASDGNFNGKVVTRPESNRRFRFIAINFYLTNSAGSDSFSFNWDSAGRIIANPVMRIKKNGVIQTEIKLSDYQFALNKLKDIYLQYDNYDPDLDAWKRYSQKGYYDDSYLENVDVWCSYISSQVLSFHFTDDNGAWEMILLSQAEGVCAPHAIDQEYDEDEDEYKDIYSYYFVYVPVVYYVVRIRSNGQTEILHQRLVVNKNDDGNGVSAHGDWTSAQSAPVTELNIKNEPYFTVNYGNCSLETNLKFGRNVKDENGNTIATRVGLTCFDYVYMTNPDKSVMKEGAVKSYIREDLQTGNIIASPQIFCGIWTGSGTSYSYYHNRAEHVAILGTPATSYLGRLILKQLDNDAIIMSIHGGYIDVINPPREIGDINAYPFNFNFEYMPNLRKLRNLGTIADLIADVTHSD